MVPVDVPGGEHCARDEAVAAGAARAIVHVLVCDDNAADRALLRVNLELEGCQVVEASDGDAALALLLGGTPLPDVVTLDAVMPGHDGWETTTRIRADSALAGIPIIMVSASSQAEDRARAELVGVDAFVAKPFDPAGLVELVLGLAARPRG